MVWSKWKGAALLVSLACAGLACAGLVYSQQAGSRPSTAGSDPSKIVFIEEPGKPKVECLILKEYRLPNGQLALDVSVLGTGETMTVIDGNAPPETQPGLLPWNKDKQQPGMPLEYIEENLVSGPPAPAAYPASQIQTVSGNVPLTPVASTDEIRSIQEPGKPAQKCRVVSQWRDANGNLNCQCQSLDTGEMITIVETGPGQPGPGTASAGPARAMVSRIFHWGRNTTPPPGVPVPPPEGTVVWSAPSSVVSTGPAFALDTEAPKPKFGERIKDWFGTLFATHQPTPFVPDKTTDQIKPAQVAKVPEKTADLAKSPPVAQVPAQTKNAELPPPLPVVASKNTFAQDLAKSPPVAQVPAQTKNAELPPPLPVVAKENTFAQDWHKQWPQSDALAEPLGKPSADSTLPPNTKAWSPALALAPVPPSAPPAAVPMPPTPAQPAAGNTTAPPSAPPAPAPAQQAPAQPAGTNKTAPSQFAAGNTTASPSAPPVPAPAEQTPAQPAGANKIAPSQPPTAPVQSKLPAPAQTLPVSKVDATNSGDPLVNPLSFITSPAVNKAPAIKELADAQKEQFPALPSGSALATDGNRKLPLGSASVIAAANSGDPRYLPAPLPKGPQPPTAPATPPDPSWYVNAFTPPLSPEAAKAAAMQQQMAQQRMMMPPGFPGAPYFNPAMMAPGQMPPGFVPMVYGPMPMMPYDMGAGRGTVPMSYQGPMPPNPLGDAGQMPMAPGYFPMPMPMPGPLQMSVPYSNPAMDRPGMIMGNPSISQNVQTLQSSLYPSQREVAANNLATYDWRTCTQVVPVLTTAAREDPAATVRSACVYALARMGVTTEPVMQMLEQLKGDNDPRVRQEAERALSRLAPAGETQPILPTAARQQ
jgi:hypothetical protein